jgi:hypothetical protein
VQQGEHYLVLPDSLNYDSDSSGSSLLPLLPVRYSSSCTTPASAQQFVVEVLQVHLSFPEHEADLPVMNSEDDGMCLCE